MLYKNEAWMREKHDIEELSPREIAKLADCSRTTIRNWLHAFGVCARTISETSRGRYHSAETKRKMSDAQRGNKNLNYGKHRSEETRQKISEAKRGKHPSEETRKKLSELRKGRHLSEETKQKIGNAHRNKYVSDETRQNLSEAKRGGKNPGWRGGVSFAPYCFKFNEAKKEEIRELHDRKCYLCGAEENGKKHCVHHTDYNKMQGCTTADWNLLPLCTNCHTKTNHNRWHWFSLLYNHWAMNPEINFGVEGWSCRATGFI